MSEATAGADAQWIPIRIEKAEVPASARLPDTFAGSYSTHNLIEFPKGGSPSSCKAIVKESNIIPQCIDAYKRNIAGYGIALEYLPGESDETALSEWEAAEKFLSTANLETSTEKIIEELIDDLEHCGNAYLEVVRGGEFPALYRLPPENIRCTPELDRIEVKYNRLIKGKVETFTQKSYVRKYAEKRNSSITWFKPFGTKGDCTEIIHLRIGNGGAYGEPRWFGNTPGVLGSRKAEELNLGYFSNGRMITMILSVINGRLTKKSIELLAQARGQESQGGILYLQVEGGDIGGPVDEQKEKSQIKLDKLNDLLQTDALFLEYGKTKREEILSAFRLPPILVGMSQDYSRATADAALRFAEEQVFQPYRNWLMDEIFNKRLFPALNIFRIKATLRGPKLVEPDERKGLLEFLAESGILLVGDLIPLAEEVLGTTVNESKFEPGYLDTPIAQLLNQQPSIPSGVDMQEKVAAIAKSLLRKSEAEAGIHV
ncbi:phage portal protein [Aneurinibacillus aneurinilyticus]|uniref:Phage portal protein n=1 Tax=Aneurinibacillus aneurinilyticus ATCC 12856 TaxID=649747 RepID=U1X6S8_ANEAE|nr:phage portal protein [Aneurinibacillus aneurinilyticus]ERI10238.1 phage portal protein [Aneurinibacillus aneurinilyticus ATCC 12856]MED0705866.1 phage portal protein [Aneurinibacillus aneurinilyticus]MED0722659.1 phage portal protein [Aneurinibacillus aneurinilyticus]MED0731421.1 phage portal protein [Aneurinibacillus aneurinilyticus]MED0740177.1 phage portal protein [Aneurinibacillus aneurinilyticus]